MKWPHSQNCHKRKSNKSLWLFFGAQEITEVILLVSQVLAVLSDCRVVLFQIVNELLLFFFLFSHSVPFGWTLANSLVLKKVLHMIATLKTLPLFVEPSLYSADLICRILSELKMWKWYKTSTCREEIR